MGNIMREGRTLAPYITSKSNSADILEKLR